MTDRRLTPYSGRVALAGAGVDAPVVVGEARYVVVPVADLCAAPGGARDRQVLYGATVVQIDQQDDWAFVQALRDGYCGWALAAALGDAMAPTHRVVARASHIYSGPKVQAPEVCPLPFGALLVVQGVENKFARTAQGFVPEQHIRTMTEVEPDPVTAAARLLGTPYLWGGNSGAGIDCSGLVQESFAACGHICPGDSDLQARHGVGVTELRRNDLIFWRGHVALVVGDGTILHANGHSMDVCFEDLHTAIARIRAAGGGEVTARRRYL